MRLIAAIVSASLGAVVLPPLTSAHAQKVSEVQSEGLISRPRSARVPDRAANDTERAYITLVQFGRCTLDRRPKLVEAALRSQPGPEEAAALERVVSGQCLFTGEMRFQPILLRGALFMEMWKRRALATAKGEEWGFDLDPIVLPATPANVSPNEKLHWALLTFATCVVEADRSAASDAVTQAPGSEREAAAYQRLMPALARCVTQGEKLTFGKALLGGALAETLYRTPPA